MTSSQRRRVPRLLALAGALLWLSIAPQIEAQAPAVNGPIAFATDRDGNYEIYVMQSDGSALTRLTNLPEGDWDPAWSPDGNRIAFRHNENNTRGQIYVMNADGTGQANLSNNAANDEGPAWSADGSAIAFHSFRDGNAEIYVMNANGTGQTRLTNHGASDYSPTWSPDATRIAFVSTRNGPAQIYVMNPNGSGQTRLTNSGVHDQSPAWSPDGSKIAFQRLEGGNHEIYVMNADGSGQTRLTNNPNHDQGPSWSPDGARVVFFRGPDVVGSDIYVMNADGTGQVNVTNHAATDWTPAWGPAPAVDSDGDGVQDAADNCPGTPPGQAVDAQGCPLPPPPPPDADGDGVPDAIDNCPAVTNADQTNTDGDAQGDACDADDDNDGTPDVSDPFPLDPLNVHPIFVVNSTADAVDAAPGNGICATASGVCTLRAAVQEANALAGPDTIQFTGTTITLTGAAGEDAGASGDLDVTAAGGPLTIVGNGAGTTIIQACDADADPACVGIDRIFDVLDAASLTLSGVTLRNGYGDGGGIRVGRLLPWGGSPGRATLVLDASEVVNNRSTGYGGGVLTTWGIVTVTGSVIANNRAVYGGGAIASGMGTLTIDRSTLSGNSAIRPGGGSAGGAIDNNASGPADVTISNSTISGNSADDGGGIHNNGFTNSSGLHGIYRISNSTLSGNIATGRGGAIQNANGIVTLANVTVAGNTALQGGGIQTAQGVNSQVASTILRNSLVALNTGDNCLVTGAGASFASDGYNLSDDSTCAFAGTGDLNDVAAGLGPLANNGGPTLTHALLGGSPAIDAGDPAGCTDAAGTALATDQRGAGFARAVDGNLDGIARCDIGAVEGIGVNADTDGDGVLDVNDAFPLDAAEWADADLDGLGNNADSDDDNDGVPDASDNCPVVSNADQADADGDGIGTACDPVEAVNGRIAFNSTRDDNHEIYAMNPDGSGQVNLTNMPGSNEQHPSWSADGTRIAFASGVGGDIHVMNADGSGRVQLAVDGGQVEPSWSPDGTRIAFSDTRDTGNYQIYVMNADGSGQTRLTNTGGHDLGPVWSPDGAHIAFASTRDGNWEIHVMNPDGTGQTRITNHPATDLYPAWSPDGTKIAFHSDRDGNNEIYVMNADGTGQVRLPGSGVDDAYATWSPDGTKIAFASLRDGNWEVYVMNADGTGQTRLTFSPGEDSQPTWAPALAPSPTDTDGDGQSDADDPDDDNDGIPDVDDAFPLDASESVDADGDGVGNNADLDDDGDGVPDATDAFPLNAAESVDTDGDGTGNNADADDDNDGIADGLDRNRLTGADESTMFSSDYVKNAATFGTITRNGWDVALVDLGVRVRATLSGAGTAPATIAACGGTQKQIRLDVAGESASWSCNVAGTLSTRALAAAPVIEVAKLVCYDGCWFQTVASLRTNRSYSTGSPSFADADSDGPVDVAILDGAGSVVGGYTLDPGEGLDIEVVIDANGQPHVLLQVLNGEVEVTVFSQTATLTATQPRRDFQRDAAPPVIEPVPDVTAEATSPAGAAVTFDAPAVSDDVDPAPELTFSHASGTTFPLGETVVTVTAVDDAGRSATRTFRVRVVDTTPPTITAPADQVLEATSAAGAVAHFAATAEDIASTPVITYSHAPGSTFPLGPTTVTATATDGSGNSASASFTITVRDTTRPTVTVPADLVVRCGELTADGRGCVKPTDPTVAAWLASAGASDTVDTTPAVTSNAPTVLPVGFTTVTFTATDDAGNTAQATARVQVVYNFGGFLPPLIKGGSASIQQGRQGRTIPVKFQLRCANGASVATAVASIAVFKVLNAATGTIDTTDLTADAGASNNNGVLFRYDAASEQYVYNLSTAGWIAPATYQIVVTLDDGTQQTVMFSLR